MYQIYGKDDCKYCQFAVALLTQRGLPFQEFKLGREFTREELFEQFPSAKSFPQIQHIDSNNKNTYIGGYNELVKHLD